MRAPLVETRLFIRAIRDAGYKGTASAIAELVDNSIEADSTEIAISVEEVSVEEGGPLVVHVADNGHGMSKAVLRTALQFGGSSRFGSRKGTGRFGMGLPNSSVSQARRLDVYTWTSSTSCFWSYLDVDEISEEGTSLVPEPERRRLPSALTRLSADHGTVVAWTRCDRLSHRRITTLIQTLEVELGRIFRFHLLKGLRLCINGHKVQVVDPLFIKNERGLSGARLYGPPLVYELKILAQRGGTSRVSVVFSELPVPEWSQFSNAEKSFHGITKRAGVSILRAGREIDFGWHFMGSKKRENYDDWWRCELHFDPDLDEEFGVTHTKQGVRPSERLRALLAPDLEKIAHHLNARVRAAFVDLKANAPCTAVRRANECDILLEPPHITDRRKLGSSIRGKVHGIQYRLTAKGVAEEAFFTQFHRNSQLLVNLNSDHPFFKRFYSLLVFDARIDAKIARDYIDLTILSAARAQLELSGESSNPILDSYRRVWSNNLAAFLA